TIGIDPSALDLQRRRSKPRLKLVKVEYDRERQREAAEACVSRWSQSVGDDVLPLLRAHGEVWMKAPLFKNAAFADEREWRLIRQFPTAACPELSFHVRPDGSLVPYVSFEIPVSLESQSPIVKIGLG